MNEALHGALELSDVLQGLAGLLLLWLLHRLSAHHPMQVARRARRVLAASIGMAAPADLDVVTENLRQLLDEATWGYREMSSWRKKAVDAWLDELVDHAVAQGLEVSDSMARFAEARQGFHRALSDSEDRPALLRAARRLAQAGEALAAAVRPADARADGAAALPLAALA